MTDDNNCLNQYKTMFALYLKKRKKSTDNIPKNNTLFLNGVLCCFFSICCCRYSLCLCREKKPNDCFNCRKYHAASQENHTWFAPLVGKIWLPRVVLTWFRCRTVPLQKVNFWLSGRDLKQKID